MFLISMNLPILTLCINGIMQRVDSWVRCFHLARKSVFHVTRVAPCIGVSFLLRPSDPCDGFTMFIYLFTRWTFGLILLFGHDNLCCYEICLEVLCIDVCFCCLGCIPRGWNCWIKGLLCVAFWWAAKLFFKEAAPFYMPSSVPLFPFLPHQYLLSFFLF